MKKPVIICVDDEKIVLDSLRQELKQSIGDNFIIEVAESGVEALDILKEIIENGQDIPVIISDYIMPEMKGDEVLQKIKEMNPETYRILLTGQATIEGVTNAINNADLYRYIAKPWETNDLIMTITEAVKGFDREKQIQQQNEEIRRKNKEITEINLHLEDLVRIRTAELEQKKQEILDSIDYSKRIQMAIMGDINLIENNFPFVSILYLPKDVVSGDFFWQTQKNNKTIFVAADCTGHGVPGAFMSIVGMSSLNQIVNEKGVTQPNEILHLLRAMIVNILSQTGKSGESKDGMDISIISIDFDAMILEYAGAFNSLYLISENFSSIDMSDESKYSIYNSSLLEIKADRMPIGISDLMHKHYTNHRFKIKPNDVFYILTDGYFDQLGGSQSKKFLSKRFKDKISEIKNENISDQEKMLLENFSQWKGDNEQIDDILVIGVKIPNENSITNLTGSNYANQEKDFFSYKGVTNRDIISKILETIEEKLIEDKFKKPFIKKIIIVLTELLQNAMFYFEEQGRELDQKIFDFKMKNESDFFHIESTNSVFPKDYKYVKHKIDKLNILTHEELQQTYKQQLNDGNLPQNHGAGLGFIVIAQRSKLPIKCELIEKDTIEMKITLEIEKK